MRVRPAVLPFVVAGTLAGCGGGETTTETVTVTKTVAQAPETPPAATAPPTTTAPAPAAPPAPPAGLPADQVALIGTFDMTVTDTGRGGINASGASEGSEEEWRLNTTCQGSDCSVEVRRRLRSGGLEVIGLEPHPRKAGQWLGEFRSKGQCGADDDIPTDASLTLRGLRAQDRVATKLEAYWRAPDIECVVTDGGVARYTGMLRSGDAPPGR